MAEKPILFNTEMVRAILDGRKTQTRRLIKAPVLYEVSEPPDRIEKVTLPWADYQFTWHGKAIGGFELKAPYRPGDVLWVRETWCKWWLPHGEWTYRYKATSPNGNMAPTSPDPEDEWLVMPWKPSVHMPREAARLFLRVQEVRIERLHDMRMADIQAEGVVPSTVAGGQWQQWQRDYMKPVWDSTIKKADLLHYGWEANPWVWAFLFERVEGTSWDAIRA